MLHSIIVPTWHLLVDIYPPHLWSKSGNLHLYSHADFVILPIGSYRHDDMSGGVATISTGFPLGLLFTVVVCWYIE